MELKVGMLVEAIDHVPPYRFGVITRLNDYQVWARWGSSVERVLDKSIPKAELYYPRSGFVFKPIEPIKPFEDWL